jgi:hypothetical protein
MVAVLAASPTGGQVAGCLRVRAGPPKAAILTDPLPVSIRPRLIDNIREMPRLHCARAPHNYFFSRFGVFARYDPRARTAARRALQQ